MLKSFSGKKIAFLFPGQGSQYVGMCDQLIQKSSLAKSVFEEANDVLNFDISSLISQGSIENLTRSKNAQLAVATASHALFSVLSELIEVSPSYLAGHSLGEISAYIASGAISFKDGLIFVKDRALIMDQAVQDARGECGVVVDLEREPLELAINDIRKQDYVTISGYNAPKQFIIAGTKRGVLLLEKAVDEMGGQFIPFKMMPMKVNAPFHSEQMSDLVVDFEKILEKFSFKKPKTPVWSAVTGEKMISGNLLKKVISQQLLKPVLWTQVLHKMYEDGVELFIDLGPDSVIRNLVKEDLGLPDCLAFDDINDRKRIVSLFGSALLD